MIDAVEFDFDCIGEGEWFPYQDSHFDQESGELIFEEPSSAARVRIRSIKTILQERFNKRKKVAEHVYNPNTKAMERISYYKDQSPEEVKKDRDDTWDYAITGLEGFKNKKTGEVIECTRENKLKLMTLPAFDRFVGRCLNILEGAEVKRKEEVEKN